MSSTGQQVRVSVHKRKDAAGYIIKIVLLDGELALKETALPAPDYEEAAALGESITNLIRMTGDASVFFPDSSSGPESTETFKAGVLIQRKEGQA